MSFSVGPGAHSFNMYVPTGWAGCQCHQILVWLNLFVGLITNNHRQVHVNWFGINIISLVVWVFSSRKLSVHHPGNRFTRRSVCQCQSLWANSWLRIAESSADLTIKFPEAVCVKCVKQWRTDASLGNDLCLRSLKEREWVRSRTSCDLPVRK